MLLCFSILFWGGKWWKHTENNIEQWGSYMDLISVMGRNLFFLLETILRSSCYAMLCYAVMSLLLESLGSISNKSVIDRPQYGKSNPEVTGPHPENYPINAMLLEAEYPKLPQQT